MNEGTLVIPFLYQFVFNAIIVLYKLFGDNLGLALIVIAVLSRLITYPFTAKQLKNASKSKEFQDEYKRVKEKYKKNKEKQSQELAKLQSRYLPGQIAGCLPLIVQFALLIQINYVIRNLLKHGAGAFNEVAYKVVGVFELKMGDNGVEELSKINVGFLSDKLNLGKSASSVGITHFSESWPYLLLTVVLVVTQVFYMRVLSGIDKPKVEKKKNTDEPSLGEIFQQTSGQMVLIFPLLIGSFSLYYPSGLSLYFATTSLFVIIQQMFMKRREIRKIIRTKYFTGEETKVIVERAEEKTEEKTKTPTLKKKRSKKRRRKKKKNSR